MAGFHSEVLSEQEMFRNCEVYGVRLGRRVVLHR